MPQVFIYSDLYLPTFPFLEISLYKELASKGVVTTFILQEGDIRLITPELSSTFEALNLLVVKNPKKDIIKLLSANDLLVMRFCYKGLGGEVATAARAAKKKVLQLDPAAVDLCFRQVPAQFVTSKSRWLTQQVLKKIGKKYSQIYTTGTIHFDAAFGPLPLTKQEVMARHGLDKNKKLVILCKSSPGESGHQFGVDKEYQQIVEIVKKQCSDYELLFKAHPLDHHSLLPAVPGVIKKNEHYQNKPSWEILFPKGISVLRPELGYNAFKVADVVLNVRSSIGMETVLFPTPLLNINSHLYITNWPKAEDPGIMKNIVMSDLAGTLNKSDYHVQPNSCRKHVLEYCDPIGDGRAYQRTAQVIGELL